MLSLQGSHLGVSDSVRSLPPPPQASPTTPPPPWPAVRPFQSRLSVRRQERQSQSSCHQSPPPLALSIPSPFLQRHPSSLTPTPYLKPLILPSISFNPFLFHSLKSPSPPPSQPVISLTLHFFFLTPQLPYSSFTPPSPSSPLILPSPLTYLNPPAPLTFPPALTCRACPARRVAPLTGSLHCDLL